MDIRIDPASPIAPYDQIRRRIAELAADGLANREIAQTLYVTTHTVEFHLRNAYRKLGIDGRGELPAALEEPAEG
jgi:DNA-binding NarL/FixJ family response regulator